MSEYLGYIWYVDNPAIDWNHGAKDPCFIL